jgi:hypothetical protein
MYARIGRTPSSILVTLIEVEMKIQMQIQMDVMISTPCSLSDEDLVAAVTRLVGCERETTASLIAHLMEFDARRLYLGAGCQSLFVYCTDVLRLSGHEAYHRIEAARLARKFPVVLRMLAEGSLNLTTARLLGAHLSDENHEDLLAAAAGKSKRQVAVLLAKTFPMPDVPFSMRKVPAPRATPLSPAGLGEARLEWATAMPLAAPAVGPAGGSVGTPAAGPVVEASAPPAEAAGSAGDSTGPTNLPKPQPPARDKRCEPRPLAADRYELRLTVSAATREKLRFATDLLRHAVPDGDAAEVIDRALTALLDGLAKKKFAATTRARPATGALKSTRHVPAHVKRAVWLRDGAQCAFVSGGRRRCRERGFLEFHHVRPYGVGGEATVDNIQLRCRAHNAYEAEWFYGRRYVPTAKRETGVQAVGAPANRETGVQVVVAPTKRETCAQRPMAPMEPEVVVQLGPDRVDAHRPSAQAAARNPISVDS